MHQVCHQQQRGTRGLINTHAFLKVACGHVLIYMWYYEQFTRTQKTQTEKKNTVRANALASSLAH